MNTPIMISLIMWCAFVGACFVVYRLSSKRRGG